MKRATSLFIITLICFSVYSDNLLPFYNAKTKKYGYKTSKGEIIVRPKYNYANEFHEGLALVQYRSKWGFIDTTGVEIIKPQYDFAKDFHGGISFVGNEKRPQVGENTDIFINAFWIDHQNNTISHFQKIKKLLVANYLTAGEPTFSCINGIIYLPGDKFILKKDLLNNDLIMLSHTFSLVHEYLSIGIIYAKDEKENYILIDRRGNILSKGKNEYQLLNHFGWFAHINDHNVHEIIDDRGNVKIANAYKINMKKNSPNNIKFYISNDDGLQGWVLKNKTVITPRYNMIIPIPSLNLKEELLVVKQNERIGVVNSENTTKIPFEYISFSTIDANNPNLFQPLSDADRHFYCFFQMPDYNWVLLDSEGRRFSTTYIKDKRFLYKHMMMNNFSYFMRNYVEINIYRWQQRGEYEKTNDYYNRVNEENRNKQIKEYVSQAHEAFIEQHSQDTISFTLKHYDPDNEVFLINEKTYGDLLVNVPINEAPKFKENWSTNVQKIPLYDSNGDALILKSAIFTLDSIDFVYENTNSLNFDYADIKFNFDPVNADVYENKSQQKIPNKQTISQTTIQVGKSDVDVNIPITQSNKQNAFAIIIANEHYNRLSDVPFALNDGKIFAQYCEKTLGLPGKNIKIYTDATYGTILEALRNINQIANAYKGQIYLIFYYAGHGAPTDDTKEAYLLPIDAFGVSPDICFSLNRLYKELNDLKINSVTIFLDACFSGATREEQMLASVRGVAIKAKTDVPIGNMAVFSAASEDQTALPYVEKSHGLFTYFLLKKLQETSGNVTFEELNKYIREEVVKYSSVEGKLQTPTMSIGREVKTNSQILK